MTTSDLRRKAWDDAMLILVCEHAEKLNGIGVDGETLLPIVIQEAGDALARLKESGALLSGPEIESWGIS